MSRSEIIGSWHNTSYYGHPRSKPRSDYVVEYRKLAAPLPPRLFTKRSQTPASGHLFSRHDNRQSQINLSLYFEEGIGRKRAIETQNNRSDNNLLTWQPCSVTSFNNENVTADRSDLTPLSLSHSTKSGGLTPYISYSSTTDVQPLSSYTVDYRGVSVDVAQLNQRLVRRLRAQSQEDTSPPTTVYRYTHCATPSVRADTLDLGGPPREPSSSSPTFSSRMMKTKSPYSRDTVGNCLTWYQPSPPPGVSRQPLSATQIYTVNTTGASLSHVVSVDKVNTEVNSETVPATKLVLI